MKSKTPLSDELKQTLESFNELMLFADESTDLYNRASFLYLAIGEWNKAFKLIKKVKKLEKSVNET